MLKRTAILAAIAWCGSAAVQQPALAQPTGADPAVARGRLLFLRCASCHEVEDRGVIKAGPTLQGVFGRASGAVSGYGYSQALKAHPLTWDAATLDQWLEKPTQLVPDTSMAFIGMAAAQDRKALIAYLQTLK